MRPEIRDRLILPILIPLGILVLVVVVLFSMSRILLAASSDAAPAIAIGIALAVLLGGTFFATQPVSRGQGVSMIAVPLVLLIAGGVWGQIEYSDKEGEHEEGGPAVVSGAVPVEMGDNFFKPKELKVKAGDELSFELKNTGAAIHNMRLAGADNKYDSGDDAVSDPDTVRAGAPATLKYKFSAPGAMDFRCDFHPTQMTGKITIE